MKLLNYLFIELLFILSMKAFSLYDLMKISITYKNLNLIL